MKKFIYLLAIMPLLSGCIKVGVTGSWFYVVKFKADYADNAIAFDYYNGSSQNCLYGIPHIPKNLPLKLTDEYYVFKEMRDNVVVLSISREEAAAGVYTSDSIKSLIIDDDPIEEWWFRDEQGNRRFKIDCYDSGCCPYDTAALNGVIKAGKLKRYFDRIK
ncbi:hypothetical protein [Bacteroides heparinolyticus]|uniref:hypothetical protein n=1 Tax=Prevotella heparinolytica TaxID=28113 RepID=UPI0035A031F6